jgi:hypothetical protein
MNHDTLGCRGIMVAVGLSLALIGACWLVFFVLFRG